VFISKRLNLLICTTAGNVKGDEESAMKMITWILNGVAWRTFEEVLPKCRLRQGDITEPRRRGSILSARHDSKWDGTVFIFLFSPRKLRGRMKVVCGLWWVQHKHMLKACHVPY